ncbi:hypothetical protein ALC60_08347 [Trachymyrmex zeteki]|uniref:Uncharacterized protein n=1 Tax=Mycetomoellerius zeteki TaxID=64791 RepID=A0A151WXJ6_9HYME|nr:hypothetical protein ALC60_08347 [Trachymyrmex zeteki]
MDDSLRKTPSHRAIGLAMIFVPIPDKSVGINNHKCKLRPDQWPNKSYGEANAEREVKRGGRLVELNRDKKIEGNEKEKEGGSSRSERED